VNLLGLDEDLSTDDKKWEPAAKGVTPEEFLGPNAKLVDFDDLVSKPTPSSEFHMNIYYRVSYVYFNCFASYYIKTLIF